MWSDFSRGFCIFRVLGVRDGLTELTLCVVSCSCGRAFPLDNKQTEFVSHPSALSVHVMPSESFSGFSQDLATTFVV